MNRIKKILFIALLSIAVSCVHSSKEIKFENDLEQATAWCNSPEIKFGKGHSGSYFSFTDSIHPYSATFNRKVKELGTERMKAAEISLWVKPLVDGAFINLVLSVDRDNKNIQYFSIDSKDFASETNQWDLVETRYEIPEGLQPDDVIKIFAWNNAGKPADVDDFEIRFKY